MTNVVDTRQLRHFGLIVGGILLAIGIWPLVWRADRIRLWAAALGLALVVAGFLSPRALRRPYRIWMAAGHVLGVVNTHVILAIVYFLVITPIALVMRLFGRDPLDRSLGDRSSYWIKRPLTSEDQASMERRF